jgi:molybdopterin/thiamine biosynthesis adenylyltransferase
MSPVVYLRERQINSLFRDLQGGRQHVVDGEAYSLDGDSVFHAVTERGNGRVRGLMTAAKFVLLPSIDAIEQIESDNPLLVESKRSGAPSLFVFLAVDRSVLKHKCFFASPRNASSVSCQIKFIPDRSDLYSRSKGLLETNVLFGKSVGIVGLGSGGSPIAVELAKAGVGRFVLIDFDRLELSNVSRHICGVSDLGRFKTLAVRDAIVDKNPDARVNTLEVDVNESRDECSQSLSKTDLIICASDNDRSRFFLNEIALKHKTTAIFGRAITRAAGGDVLRVRPLQGPCYSCLYSQNVRQEGSDDEEISQHSQAKTLMPEYTSEQEVNAVIQVGLSSDIAPISNFMVKLALVELSKGLNSGIASLEEDFIADFYIWANRRDSTYATWSKLEFGFNKPTILRWYGARVQRDPSCMVCAT